MEDVLGEAMWDYYHQQKGGPLWIHNRYGRKESMPVRLYFRSWEQMPELEKRALKKCRGKVLDVGAGAGAHSLVLQQMGLDVTALDLSTKAVQIAQLRGVQKAVAANIFQFEAPPFDTVLLLMNGIGLAGSLQGLRLFLQKAKSLLHKKGQLLFDSSDVAYLYKKAEKPADRYYGEIEYQYEYKKKKTAPFTWLYVDYKTLTAIAAAAGWHTTLLHEDGYDQYLAQLTPKGP